METVMRNKLQLMLTNVLASKPADATKNKQWYNNFVTVYNQILKYENPNARNLAKVCSACSSARIKATNEEINYMIEEAKRILTQ